MVVAKSFAQGTRGNTNYQLHRIACLLEEIRDELRKLYMIAEQKRIDEAAMKGFEA